LGDDAFGRTPGNESDSHLAHMHQLTRSLRRFGRARMRWNRESESVTCGVLSMRFHVCVLLFGLQTRTLLFLRVYQEQSLSSFRLTSDYESYLIGIVFFSCGAALSHVHVQRLRHAPGNGLMWPRRTRIQSRLSLPRRTTTLAQIGRNEEGISEKKYPDLGHTYAPASAKAL